MPFDCQHRRRFGQSACLESCLALRDPARFVFLRVERGDDVPSPDPRAVDVAILDMHHGWPNLGHAAIVHALQNAVCDVRGHLDDADLVVRAVSYDVRRASQIPAPPGERHGLYVGTGGPGHLDPRQNDGVREGSQGIAEDPAWEAPVFELFDRIADDPRSALLGVCHTFGVMCRWRGVAEAVLRGPEKGGKSAGIVDNVLTDAALRHPWFGRLARQVPDPPRVRVLDNRLYDLVPRARDIEGVLAVAHEALPDERGQRAVTMIEFAADDRARMPRVFGVNHHPEVVNRPRLLTILMQKKERREVDERDPWFEERRRGLTEPISDVHGDRLLHLSSSYTFLGPMRYWLYRSIRERAETLGRPVALRETDVPIAFSLEHEPTALL